MDIAILIISIIGVVLTIAGIVRSHLKDKKEARDKVFLKLIKVSNQAFQKVDIINGKIDISVVLLELEKVSKPCKKIINEMKSVKEKDGFRYPDKIKSKYIVLLSHHCKHNYNNWFYNRYTSIIRKPTNKELKDNTQHYIGSGVYKTKDSSEMP